MDLRPHAMARRSSRKARNQLHVTSREQYAGYFTAKQAARLGYTPPLLHYHSRVGNIEHVGHGLYRLATVPISEHDDLVRFTLWSRDRSDEPQAVISHVTALVVHDLTDLLPSSIHLTVPPRFQKKAPRGCRLHRAVLASTDIEERDGFRVTTPFRTLLDAAHSPEVSQDELEKAIRSALDRGIVRRDALVDAANGQTGRNRLGLALERAREGS